MYAHLYSAAIQVQCKKKNASSLGTKKKKNIKPVYMHVAFFSCIFFFLFFLCIFFQLVKATLGSMQAGLKKTKQKNSSLMFLYKTPIRNAFFFSSQNLLFFACSYNINSVILCVLAFFELTSLQSFKNKFFYGTANKTLLFLNKTLEKRY